MSCSNIISDLKPSCEDYIRPMSVEERRQLWARQNWIENVTQILGIPKDEAESLWIKIQMEKQQ